MVPELDPGMAITWDLRWAPPTVTMTVRKLGVSEGLSVGCDVGNASPFYHWGALNALVPLMEAALV